MSAEQMPERYRPDPWIDAPVNADARRPNPDASFPQVVMREWLDATPGERLGVAPKSERAVTVGRTTPRILGDFAVSRYKRRDDDPRAKVPLFALRYIGAKPGGEIRFERVDAGRVTVTLREVSP